MPEALRSAPPRQDPLPPEPELESLAPVEPSPALLESVDGLLERAQSGLDGEEVAQLARMLRVLSRRPSREVADRLLQALALEPLWLYAHDGLRLRTIAAEALVELGYPYALEIPPEALEEALADRTDRAHRRHKPWAAWGLAALGVAAACAWAIALEPDRWNDVIRTVLPVQLVGFGVPALLASVRWSRVARGLGMTALLLFGAVELWLGTVLPGAHWLVSAGGALQILAVPFFSFRLSGWLTRRRRKTPRRVRAVAAVDDLTTL